MAMHKERCHWAQDVIDIYKKYHDEEWGVPSYDDHYLFEMLILESFHCGLSWLIVLKKREAFKKAFDNFDAHMMSEYSEEKIETLCNNPDIIRNRQKILAAKSNAIAFIKVQKEFGSFSKYIWHFTDGQIVYNVNNERLTKSPLSDRITKDMKKRGFKFVGSVTIYSYLQAIGIINDHESQCFLHKPHL